MRYRSYLSKLKSEVLLYSKGCETSVYLSDGMPRSGSTLVYNALRLCLQENYGDKLVCGWVGDLSTMPKATAYCIKVHGATRPVYRKATFTCYTYRDLRTALVSGHRMFNRTPTLALARSFIKKDQLARRVANRVYRYEHIVGNKRELIEDLIQGVGGNADSSRIMSQLSKIRIGNDSTAPELETQMHGGHATGTMPEDWREELSVKFLDELYTNFAWWFEDNGYAID